jgi:hypothetical protein
MRAPFVPVLLLLLLLLAAAPARAETARGVVFEDLNRNGRRDPGEPGLRGVRVSNQREITLTDRDGRWALPASDDTVFFVIKPRGFMPPLNADRLPQFHYVHKPAGSPPNLKYRGVPPTGPLPASIDFPLHRQREPREFKAVFMGDTQPRDVREVGYFKEAVVPELVGTDAAFGVTLGDVVFDDLSVFEPHNQAVALIGLPWWNVLGNHDLNFDSPDDAGSTETWQRVYGPNYYSFDHGPVHFIVLDDVEWLGPDPERQTGNYRGGLDARQLEFVKNDLALVPDRQLVVLMMHIPLTDVGNRGELYRLIERRRHALSISGHTHWQEHRFIGPEDGWRGREPHHHIVTVTACGSWWTGAPGPDGIPHTTMRDGAPHGYAILTFDGTRVTMDFKAARRPAAEQMNVMLPATVAAAELPARPLYVNVFNGSERSTVEYRVNGRGRWTKLDQVLEHDPSYVARQAAELANPPPIPPYRKMSDPILSPHLWKAALPALPPGEHRVEVRTKDMHGRVYRAEKILQVTP